VLSVFTVISIVMPLSACGLGICVWLRPNWWWWWSWTIGRRSAPLIYQFMETNWLDG